MAEGGGRPFATQLEQHLLPWGEDPAGVRVSVTQPAAVTRLLFALDVSAFVPQWLPGGHLALQQASDDIEARLAKAAGKAKEQAAPSPAGQSGGK